MFTPDQVTSDYEEGVVAVKSLEGASSTKSTDLELGETEGITEEPEIVEVEDKPAPEDVGEATKIKEAPDEVVEARQLQAVALPEGKRIVIFTTKISIFVKHCKIYWLIDVGPVEVKEQEAAEEQKPSEVAILEQPAKIELPEGCIIFYF